MVRPRIRTLLIATTVIALSGVIASAWYQREQRRSVYRDAQTIFAPVDLVTPRDVLWKPAETLENPINTQGNDFEPAITRDGLTLFFVRGRAAHNADLWYSVRTPSGWTEPVELAGVNSDADELGPEPSPDGNTLYFYSDRAGGHGGYDLWSVQRTEDGWDEPVNLGSEVNSAHHDYGPCISPDGSRLYFASDRDTPEEVAALAEAGSDAVLDPESRDYDLYECIARESGFGDAQAVSPLNTDSNEGAPAFSPTGDFLYFASDRSGGEGGFDLYRARRFDGEFLTLSNLGDAINTPANELDPSVALRGFGLYFSSDRVVDDERVDARGVYNLYYAESREVFAETETWRARIDWAALIATLLPWLIFLGLLGLVTALMARLLHQLQYNRMNLLAKCMLGSLMAHLLLLALLAMWGVSTRLADSLRPAGSMRVVLRSPSVGSDVASQIRGEMTNVEVNAESSLAERQSVETDTLEPDVSEAALEVERTEVEVPSDPSQLAQLNEADAQPIEAPDPTRPDQVDEIMPTGAATPTEQQRIAALEAARVVPDQVVHSPSADRAEETALDQASRPVEVALQVNQADAAAQATETLARVDSHREAETAELTPTEPTPLEVTQRDTAPVRVAIAPVVKSLQADEAQQQVDSAARALSRQAAAESTSTMDGTPQQATVTPQPNGSDLPRQSMAREIQAQPAPDVAAAMPDASPQATPDDARQTQVALRELPQAAAARQAEAVAQVRPTQSRTERVESEGASTLRELEVSEVAHAPEQSRLTDTGPSVTEVQRFDAHAATMSDSQPVMNAERLADASSAMTVDAPVGDAPQPEQATEATSSLQIASATSSRADTAGQSQAMPSDNARAVNMNPAPATDVARATQSLAQASAMEAPISEASMPVGATSPTEIVIDQAVVAARIDVPDEQAGGGPVTEQSFEPLNAASQVATSRQGDVLVDRSATPDAQVAVASEAADLAESARPLARMTESDATPAPASATLANTPPRPAAPTTNGFALNVPIEREESGERPAPANDSAERQLQSLMANASRPNGRAALSDRPSSSSTDAVEVALDPTAGTPLTSDRSLARSTDRQSSRAPQLAFDADASPRATIEHLAAFDVALPAATTDAPDVARSSDLSERLAVSPGSPDGRRHEQFHPLATLAMSAAVAPTDVQYQLDQESLAINLLTNADGVSPTPSHQLNSTQVTDGLVIPELPDVMLPSLEQQSAGQANESDRRFAGRDARTGRSRGSDMLYAANRIADSLERVAATPMAALDRQAAPVFAARMPGAGGAELIDRLALETVPDLDRFNPALPLDLKLDFPLEELSATNPYVQRAPELREQLVEMMGGSEETEQAVKLALDWLSRHQSRDGRWDGDDFDRGCDECDGEARVEVDIGLTGLSLLCFLAADHTHTEVGPYQDTVKRAIDWLVSRQRRDGSLITGESMYSHGIATIALAEAYGMTADPNLANPVQRAVDFIYDARNREVGGWRYGPGQVGDTSVLGWQIMALKSAEKAGLDVPSEALEVGRRWLDVVSRNTPRGQYRYQPDASVTPAMVAEGMFVNQLLGAERDDRDQRASARFILDRLPEWDECNVYFWYYATLAMFQHQGEEWDQWNASVSEVLIENQHTSGLIAGSWDPHGQWAGVGGRVYQTAISTLILEVYYRYLPSFVGEAGPARNAIRGRITDGITGEPLPDAVVMLDLGESGDVDAHADADGRYTLLVPEVPSFIAVSASRTGYTPVSINVAAEDIEGRVLVRNFALMPIRGDVVAVELVPEVHHLGNNEFSGRINSQFQKQSEGLIYEHGFLLVAEQIPPDHETVRVTMLARGLQADNEIRINGRLLEQRLNRAPRDGSFGRFEASFPARWLNPGENSISIHSMRGNADLDDFEFVNVQIELGSD